MNPRKPFLTGALVVTFALFSTSHQASARQHVVSTLEEFNAAVAAARPGDEIIFSNGTWRDLKLNFRAQGQSGNPITLRAQTPGATVFEGSTELVIDGSHLVVSGFKFQNNSNLTRITTPYNVEVARVILFTTNTAHCRLTDTAVVDSGPGVSTYVHMEPGSVSNRVDRCFFSNQGAIGVTFYIEVHPSRPNYHVVEHNYFGDRKPGTGNRWETIRIGHSEQQTFTSGATIAHNYFYMCDGENEIVSVKSTGNRILSNTFKNNRGELTLRHGDKTRVEGNWFLADNTPGSGGVRIIGSDHVVVNNYFSGLRTYAITIRRGIETTDPRSYTQVKNALIAFNTIVDCPRSLTVASGSGTLIPADVTIANNIFYYPSGSLIQYSAAPTNFVYEGNIMMGETLGIPDPGGITMVDPKLVRDENGIYRPGPDSPARHRAAGEYSSVMLDISGNARAGTRDVGAQVFSPGAKTGRPLTAADVGPGWTVRSDR